MTAFLIETWPQVGGVLGLLVCNALLVACELSLIKLRFSHFNPDLLERMRSEPRLTAMLDRADLVVRVIRLSMIGCLLAYALIFVPWLLRLFTELGMTATEGSGAVLFWALAFLIALSVQHVFGELVPRGLGLQYPVRSLRTAYWMVRLLTWVVRPVAGGLNHLARTILRGAHADSAADLNSLDMEVQIELIGENAQGASQIIQGILKNTLRLRGLVVSDVLLPRHQVQYFDVEDSLEANLEVARSSGHTRFPLCQGDLDRCIGIVHIKDIFRHGGETRRLDLRRIKRGILRMTSEEPLESALQKLLSHKLHMGLVMDEFGGTQGVITLERILEELVGSIQDEFDFEEDEIQRLASGVYLVSGLTPIHEVESLFDCTMSNEDVSTFSGLITAQLGRIPKAGETLQLDGLEVHIVEVDEKRVIAARVREAAGEAM